jgi:hypothetical protein
MNNQFRKLFHAIPNKFTIFSLTKNAISRELIGIFYSYPSVFVVTGYITNWEVFTSTYADFSMCISDYFYNGGISSLFSFYSYIGGSAPLSSSSEMFLLSDKENILSSRDMPGRLP